MTRAATLGWRSAWIGLRTSSLVSRRQLVRLSARAGRGARWRWGLPGRRGGCCRCCFPLLAATRPLFGASDRESAGRWLAAAGTAGLALVALQGFAIGLNGWNAAWLAALLGSPGPRQAGMGFGAALTSVAVPDAALPRARGARLVPGRRLRGVVDRPRRRADRRLRVLSRHDDPHERRAGRCRRLRARRVLEQNSSIPRSGASTASPPTCAAASPGTPCSWRRSSASARRRSASPSR